jgi:hypothetical protein
MSAIAMDDLLLAKSFAIGVDLALTWVNSARGLGFSADLTEVNSNAPPRAYAGRQRHLHETGERDEQVEDSAQCLRRTKRVGYRIASV